MRKEKEIARLQKHCNALNELNKLVIKGDYDSREIRNILSRHKVSLTLFTFATRAGLFTNIKRGEFKSNYNIIEPYQIRKVLELVKQYNSSYKRDGYIKKNIKPIVNYNLLNENEAISFLKQLGYKIMKPINQYEEV